MHVWHDCVSVYKKYLSFCIRCVGSFVVNLLHCTIDTGFRHWGLIKSMVIWGSGILINPGTVGLGTFSGLLKSQNGHRCDSACTAESGQSPGPIGDGESRSIFMENSCQVFNNPTDTSQWFQDVPSKAACERASPGFCVIVTNSVCFLRQRMSFCCSLWLFFFMLKDICSCSSNKQVFSSPTWD